MIGSDPSKKIGGERDRNFEPQVNLTISENMSEMENVNRRSIRCSLS